MELGNIETKIEENNDTKVPIADNPMKKMENIIKRKQEQYDIQNLRECLVKKREAGRWVFKRDPVRVNMREFKRMGKLINNSSKNIRRLDLEQILCLNFQGLRFMTQEIKKLDSLQQLSIHFQV